MHLTIFGRCAHGSCDNSDPAFHPGLVHSNFRSIRSITFCLLYFLDLSEEAYKKFPIDQAKKTSWQCSWLCEQKKTNNFWELVELLLRDHYLLICRPLWPVNHLINEQ